MKSGAIQYAVVIAKSTDQTKNEFEKVLDANDRSSDFEQYSKCREMSLHKGFIRFKNIH